MLRRRPTSTLHIYLLNYILFHVVTKPPPPLPPSLHRCLSQARPSWFATSPLTYSDEHLFHSCSQKSRMEWLEREAKRKEKWKKDINMYSKQFIQNDICYDFNIQMCRPSNLIIICDCLLGIFLLWSFFLIFLGWWQERIPKLKFDTIQESVEKKDGVAHNMDNVNPKFQRRPRDTILLDPCHILKSRKISILVMGLIGFNWNSEILKE